MLSMVCQNIRHIQCASISTFHLCSSYSPALGLDGSGVSGMHDHSSQQGHEAAMQAARNAALMVSSGPGSSSSKTEHLPLRRLANTFQRHHPHSEMASPQAEPPSLPLLGRDWSRKCRHDLEVRRHRARDVRQQYDSRSSDLVQSIRRPAKFRGPRAARSCLWASRIAPKTATFVFAIFALASRL